MPNITVPTLLINASDDPFYTVESCPFKEAEGNPNFHFESPLYGGHCGFASGLLFNGVLWHEARVVDFFKKHLV